MLVVSKLEWSQGNKSLDQNLHRLLSEEWMYPPDGVVHGYAGVYCDSRSQGQLVIQCHTKAPCSLSLEHYIVLNIN